jgi:hypothetical protein
MQELIKFNGQKFIQLSLSGCSLTTEKMAILANGLKDTTLEYADFTWN